MLKKAKVSMNILTSLVIVSLLFCISCKMGAIDESSKDVSIIKGNIAEAFKNNRLVGLSVAAARQGRLLWAEGYGLSDLIEKRPVNRETMFAIGSITKQFTSACIFILAQEGKLDISDRVSKYFPNLTRASDITLLDLMNHVSGYHDYYPLDFVDRRMVNPTAVDSVIETYAGSKLDFEPGTRYSYSNTGYLILGRVVEKVAGMPFGEFLNKCIFEPLGMNHTAFDPDLINSNFAKGHMSFILSPPEQVTLEAKGWIYSAGAIFSTPSDLIKWNNALFSGRIINGHYLKIMTSPRTLSDGNISNYGCGLAIGEKYGETIYSHSGAVNGFIAINWYVPNTKSSLILCSNLSEYAVINSIFSKLVDEFLIKPGKRSKKELEQKTKADKVNQTYVGKPLISDPPLMAQAINFFFSLKNGTIDRTILGDDFSWFLTDEKIREASFRLKTLGEPVSLKIENISERGGMEVSTFRLNFESRALRVLMYRSLDGKIQQYFIQRY